MSVGLGLSLSHENRTAQNNANSQQSTEVPLLRPQKFGSACSRGERINTTSLNMIELVLSALTLPQQILFYERFTSMS